MSLARPEPLYECAADGPQGGFRRHGERREPNRPPVRRRTAARQRQRTDMPSTNRISGVIQWTCCRRRRPKLAERVSGPLLLPPTVPPSRCRRVSPPALRLAGGGARLTVYQTAELAFFPIPRFIPFPVRLALSRSGGDARRLGFNAGPAGSDCPCPLHATVCPDAVTAPVVHILQRVWRVWSLGLAPWRTQPAPA